MAYAIPIPFTSMFIPQKNKQAKEPSQWKIQGRPKSLLILSEWKHTWMQKTSFVGIVQV